MDGVTDANAALFADLYELAMLQAYFDEGLRDEAVFDLYVRELPEQRNYLLACGLDDALAYLERCSFSDDALAYLDSLGRFSPAFLDSLADFHFSGDVHAVPEGTPVFAGEPIMELVAPLPEAQLAETFLINQIQLQTMIASKGVRTVAAAAGRTLVDFGARRAHGTDAALKAARALSIAGFDATSNVIAGQAYGIAVSGTMAHSYVQAHDDELAAFRAFVASHPDTTLLVDTYDTVGGVEAVIRLARELGDNFRVRALRLDSGDSGVAGSQRASHARRRGAGSRRAVRQRRARRALDRRAGRRRRTDRRLRRRHARRHVRRRPVPGVRLQAGRLRRPRAHQALVGEGHAARSQAGVSRGRGRRGGARRDRAPRRAARR